jgi:hypothetical protein
VATPNYGFEKRQKELAKKKKKEEKLKQKQADKEAGLVSATEGDAEPDDQAEAGTETPPQP